MILRKAICVAITLALFGCGGGGGGSDDSSSSTDTESSPITISSSDSLNLVEGTSDSVSVKIDYSGSAPLSYSVDFGTEEPHASWTFKDGILSIDPKSLTHASSDHSITLTVTDGNVSRSITIPTHFENTSGDALEVEAKAFVSSFDTLYSLSELKKVESAYASILDFQDISYEVSSVNTSYYTKFKNSVSSLKQAISQYQSNDITESALQSSLDAATSAYQNLANAELSIINNLVSYDSSNMTKLPSAQLVVNGNQYSSFIGNTTYGSYSNGIWTFDSAYAFLADLVDPTTQCLVS